MARCGVEPAPAARGRWSRRGQHGAAIVTVLLIVSLATVIVSGLFWREHVAVRSIENRLALAQTRWIERAAIDWARVILANDLRGSNTDWLGEPWATPVADTKLDETVTAGGRIDDRGRAPAMLAGQIFDAQGFLNLNNLVVGGMRQPAEVEAFGRLLELLGKSSALAEQLAARLLAAAPPAGVQPTALPMKRLADLRELPGFDDETIGALEPFAIFLPLRSGFTKVNVNTAPAEVIAARVPSLEGNLARARAMVEQRTRQSFFKSTSDAANALADPQGLDANQWSVVSDHFLLRGVIRYERVVSRTDTLLRRTGPGQPVEVVWQDRY